MFFFLVKLNILIQCNNCLIILNKVIVIWDEEDCHSKHMFGESIARARSLLQIVTCKSNEKKSFWNFGKLL